jgi:hypothetical protein
VTARTLKTLLVLGAVIVSALLVLRVAWPDEGDPDVLRRAPSSFDRCVTDLFPRSLVSLEAKEVSESAALPEYLPEGFLLVAGSGGEAGPVWADDDCSVIALFTGQGPDVIDAMELGRWTVSERPHATTFPCPASEECWVVMADFRGASRRLESVGISREEAVRIAQSID